MFEQNTEHVLIPICDHYHSIKLHLSTPSTGWQKESGYKKVAMPLFQFLNGVKAGGRWFKWGAHMCELMWIDVTVSAMNHAGCG